MRGLLLAVAWLASACTAPAPTGPYGTNEGASRDVARSAEFVDEASAVEATDALEAERLLREALAADLFDAKAHNNLGVLLLRRGNLYGAATEFEWARKLLPGHPEPRVNLALTLERAGQYDSAGESYRAAPGYIAATQDAARLPLFKGDELEHLALALADRGRGGVGGVARVGGESASATASPGVTAGQCPISGTVATERRRFSGSVACAALPAVTGGRPAAVACATRSADGPVDL